MGSSHSKNVLVGKKIEDAIRFGIDVVEFDGDVSSSLDKVKPEIEKSTGYSYFWSVKRTIDPFSGTFTETDYSLGGVKNAEPAMQSNLLYNKGMKTTNFASDTVQRTVVEIRQMKDLKDIPKIDWENSLK
jgi:hypothetical protein